MWARSAGSPQVVCRNDLWLFHCQRSAFGVGFGADTNRSFLISLHMPVAGQRSAWSDKMQSNAISSVIAGAFWWTLKALSRGALTFSLWARGSFFLMRQLSNLINSYPCSWSSESVWFRVQTADGAIYLLVYSISYQQSLKTWCIYLSTCKFNCMSQDFHIFRKDIRHSLFHFKRKAKFIY